MSETRVTGSILGATRAESPRSRSWYVTALVALLAIAIFINYVDRGNLATAAPLIKDELKLSNTQIGFLLSAFFWSYAPALLVIGWATERFRASVLLAWSVALWSIATALTGLVSGFAPLLLLRLLLGFGESGAFPCVSKLLAETLPPEKLGAANGAVGAGLAIGPAFGTLAGGLVMAHFGWRAAFLAFGAASLLWLIPWNILVRTASVHMPPHQPVRAPTYLAIIRKRAAWGTILGHFSSNYALYFVLTWLPLYLVKDRGFSMTEMSELGGLAYLLYGASAMTAGILLDRLIAAGAAINTVRKTGIVIGHAGAAICLLASAAGGPALALAGLLATGVFFGLIGSCLFAIAQTIAGPKAAGKWVALQNCIANFGGILAPLVTGFIVDRTGSFSAAFGVASAIVLVGCVAWGLIVPRVAPIDWSQET